MSARLVLAAVIWVAGFVPVYLLLRAAERSWVSYRQARRAAHTRAGLDETVLLGQLPRAGQLEAWSGRCGWCRDPYCAGDHMPAFAGAGVPFDLATLDAAMTVIERQRSQDEVSREVAAIVAEVEANPERWRS